MLTFTELIRDIICSEIMAYEDTKWLRIRSRQCRQMESFSEHPQLVKFLFLKNFWKNVGVRDFCFVVFMFMFVFFIPHQSAVEEIMILIKAIKRKTASQEIRIPVWIEIKYSTSVKNISRWRPHLKSCCRGRIVIILIRYHTFPSQDSYHSTRSFISYH